MSVEFWTEKSNRILMLLVIALCWSFLITSVFAKEENRSEGEINSPNHELTENDKRKKELEIKKLETEIRSNFIGPWLQFGTVLIALIAASISFWSALQSQKSRAESLMAQIDQDQKNRNSDLLKELGSENSGVKIAAIQALSDHHDAYRFIINLLKYEKDPHIIDSIIASIQKSPDHSLPLIIGATNALKNQMVSYAGTLVTFGFDKKEISTLLGIDNASLTRWLDSPNGKRVFSVFDKKVKFLRLFPDDEEVNKSIDEQKALTLSHWEQIEETYAHVLRAAESVISAASEDGKPRSIKGAYLKGAILDHLDMSNWSFEDCDLRETSFRDSICNKTVFSNCQLEGADFKSASLHDSVFQDSFCNRASFYLAKLSRASFINGKLYGSNFTAAKANNARFVGAKLVQSKFISLFGAGVDFTDAVLKGADFNDSKLSEVNFTNSDLSGASFRFTKTSQANFSGAKFAGTDFYKANIKKSTFSKAQFSSITEFEESSFPGAILEGIQIENDSGGFGEFLSQASREEGSAEENK